MGVVVTPGFAKTRAELPWLYYPRNDRVLINSHNFPSSGWTPAVNGKSPINAWVPSRDTAGNGTTTLTDLSGSNNGTLTNMELADWVADTNAGGVRALEFDGVNEDVQMGTISAINGATVVSMSAWIYRASTGTTVGLGGAAGVTTNRFSLIWFSDGNVYISASATANTYAFCALTGTGWKHIVVNYNGAASGDSNRLKVSIGGVSKTMSFSGTVPSALGTVTPEFSLGRDASNRYSGGRIDDVRLFTQALDSSDIAALYASGNGRGVQA